MGPTNRFHPLGTIPRTLIEAVRATIRRLRTEEAYVRCIRAFIRFHHGKHQIMVRRRKGPHDRPAFLPARARDELQAQLDTVARLHKKELVADRGEVDLPHALRAKMPGAAMSLAWQYLFPAPRPCADPATGRQVLYHLYESAVQRAMHDAGRAAGITKRATCHTLRHSFATHLLDAGTDIRTVQTLLDHNDMRTTMVDAHIVHRGPLGVTSPLGR